MTALIIAAAVMVALIAYVVMGGADYGAGVWDLFASGPRKQAQRGLIAEAIGPIWEANHVWLILVVVLLFVCFPAVFARLSVALHIPLTLMLVGVVLRGSAFTFRSYDSKRDDVQRRWGLVFSWASLVTPLLLGVSAGAVAAGTLPAEVPTSFRAGFLDPWLQPFPFAVGVLALALMAFLAAVYLSVESFDAALQDDFRARALGAGAAVFVAAMVTLALSRRGAPLVWEGLTASRWAPAYHAAVGTLAVTTFWALWARRFRLARLAAPAQAVLILLGWAFVQYPYLLPPDLTIANAAAPDVTLRLVLGALVAGLVLLVPSLFYLFKVFKGAPTPPVA
ncbi:MAG TPA: cytochrome d ubiquinol oxidase subunit II [Gemmatimonadales bacterium]|nr:cytochrome d ubiquinol oxidase subunit II [Gemmatimonadales bacterium]